MKSINNYLYESLISKNTKLKNNFSSEDCIVHADGPFLDDIGNDYWKYRVTGKNGDCMFIIPIEEFKKSKYASWPSIFKFEIPDKYKNISDLAQDFREGKLDLIRDCKELRF